VGTFLDISDIKFEIRKNGFVSYLMFTHDDPVFMGHYPGYPIYPASLVVDICCEKICKYLLVDDFKKLGLSVLKANFYQGIRPGNKVLFEFCFTDSREKQISQINVELKVDNKVITSILFRKKLTKRIDIKKLCMNYDESVVKSWPAIDYLPQRFPLLMVDRILDNEDMQTCKAVKYVSYNDYCYRDTCRSNLAFKDFSYPHGAVIEGIEQSAGLLLAMHWNYASDANVIVIGKVSGISFYRNAYPGDVIKFHSVLNYLSESYAILSGSAIVSDHILLTVDKIFVVKQEAGNLLCK
jgi:3-hydroxymyristoyl/3-hydroxydecanoyl-(acyl carrier protein) dehydratase